jgi:murein DD-endopeptidase MepM/ murein hydrolase activator NlpD
VDVKSRHVVVDGRAIRVYCSAACLEARNAVPTEPPPIEPPRRPRRMLWLFAGSLALGAGALLVLRDRRSEAHAPPPPLVAAAIEVPQLGHATAESTEERRQAVEAALMGELARDTWIHPLAGPNRRMPVNHNGAFGAQRPGERPPECVSGHCGVDLGHTWGEPIYAAHDGVIDFVQRGSNEERGGMFVRIGHRGGTLYTWYFHLAAIPKSIQPGMAVSAGTVGLLGDTGIKHSAPHLHFALSVKHSKNVERYLDPEPLIAIWPLWIPNEDRTSGRLSTEAPGLPVRATSRRRPRPKPAKVEVEVEALAPPVEEAAATPMALP